MPDPSEILQQLTTISQKLFWVAVAWHGAVLLCAIALLRGWRPSRSLAGRLLALPLISAGAIAGGIGNPFNATVLLATSLFVLGMAARFRPDRVESGASWRIVAGIGMIAFGLLYPHFLQPQSPFLYAVAAPTGLVPCPTLAVVIGFLLVGNGLSSPAVSMVLAAVGAFYGSFGWLRLGVGIDVVLLTGSLALAAGTLFDLRRSRGGTQFASIGRAPH